MDDIARAAGSTKPRLYRHFADRGELFQAVAERIGRDLYRVVRPDFDFVMRSPLDALRKAVRAYAEVISQHPNVFQFLAQTQLSPGEGGSTRPSDVGRDVSQRLSRIAAGVLEAIQIGTDGVELATRTAVAAIVAATDLWLSPGDATPLTQSEFVDQTCVIVWGMIQAFLDSKGAQVDPNEPMYLVLARRAGNG